MSDAERRRELRQRFKSLFKMGKAGAKVKGSSFDTSYIKSLAKNDKGLEEIKKIYSEVLVPLDNKMMTYLQGKSLEQALEFKVKSQNQLVETLENYVKTKTDESRDIFLTAGLGFSPEQVEKFEFSFTEEKPKQTEAGAIPEAQREIMKGVEKAKIRMVDKVQEKGEKKLTVEEMKKITESLVDTALDNAVKEIEKKEKLNKEQKEIIRDQLQMEIEGKIKESSKLAGLTISEEMMSGVESVREDEEDEPILSRKEMKELSKKKVKEQEEMTTAKEDIAEEKEAQSRAKEMRSQPKPKITEEEEVGTSTEQEQETPQETSNENVKMEMKKPNMKTEIDDLQPLPSKSDFIPPMRLGTRGKDIKDLLEDIAYFMKNFKSQLKRESEIFKEVDKTNIEQLRKLHNKIVGKLAPKVTNALALPKEKKEEGKKVGIVVNADEYIREQMKKILQEQTFSSLRPQDVVIDVGSRASEGRDTKDFGDFAVKRTIDGGLASTREAVFRYMPSENDQDVGEEGKTEKQRKKPNRISMPKSRLNNERTTAMRMNVRNPFRVPQKTMKLKYLY